MAIVSWIDQLDLVELQFNEVSSVLKVGDADSIQSSTARLQQLSVELLQLSNGLAAEAVRSQSSVLRVQALARSLPVLREVLIRRAAHVETALQIVMPSVEKATYFGQGPYGGGIRQSGSLKPICA